MSHSRTDRTLSLVLRLCALLCGLILLLILLFLIGESWPALRGVGAREFLGSSDWHPNAIAARGSFGMLPMVWGSLLVSFGAVALATPLGLGTAIYAHAYAPPPLARLHRALLGLLAGIPSVVYGFFGIVVLVPWIGRIHPPGPSLLAGILILTLMILPTVALSADAALASLPPELPRGAAALGLSRWHTIRWVLLPAARSGIGTGILLETGRALGETMAVLMVCGNVVQTPHGLFDPLRTLTANIALEMAFAMGDHRAALFAGGLLLTLLVGLLVASASLLARRRKHA